MDVDLNDVTLEDEEGRKLRFKIITKFNIEDREYVIAVPKDNNNSGEAIALRIDVDKNGNNIFRTVEDEEEFSAVDREYRMLFEDDI